MSTATGARTALSRVPASTPDLVIQTLAHELRQPLSAMESIAYYLDLVLDHGDQRARDHAARLHGLVEQSNWILSCGLELALLSDTSKPIVPVLVDLTELITQTLAGRLLPGQAPPELILADDLPLVNLDPARGRVLVANLLTLFERLAERPSRVQIRTSFTLMDAALDSVVLELCAPVGHDKLPLRELSWGAGGLMGIESMQRVAQAHAGQLEVFADRRMGYRAILSLPAGPGALVP